MSFPIETVFLSALAVLLAGVFVTFLIGFVPLLREKREPPRSVVVGRTETLEGAPTEARAGAPPVAARAPVPAGSPPQVAPERDASPAGSPRPVAAPAAPSVDSPAPPPVARAEARPDLPPVVEAPPPARAPEPSRAPDWLGGLRRTREAFVGRLESLLRGRGTLDRETLDEIEALLFGADLGVQTADELLEAARAAGGPAEVRAALEHASIEILRKAEAARGVPPEPRPGSTHVILMVGVNGAGKTTTIGKLAHRYIAQGKRVLLAAADTYRAAAMDQLEVWAERSGAAFVKGKPGGDPASVAFDGVRSARSEGIDVVMIDSAGRLQTDRGLMDELQKMARVVKKEIPDAPHEVLLVLDANTGQNAIRQAKEFEAAVDVTGIVLSKLDGTAKGGVVLGISKDLGLPVRYVGLGEGIDDIADFDAAAFVSALFAGGSAPG